MTFSNNKDEKIFGFNDRIRLGDGVFDTQLIIAQKNGTDLRIPFPLEHFERLINNAQILNFPVEQLPKAEELKNKAIDFAAQNINKDGRYALNTLITRGAGKRGLMPPESPKLTLDMHISEVPDTFPPIHAVICETVRRNEGSPLSQIKSCNYGDNILAIIEAQQKNANEAILLNNAGNVTCASSGNIFACIDDKLVTPPLSDGVMNGISRQIILTRMENQIQERSISREELENAQGIYITNSIKGIRALESLNGKPCPKPIIYIAPYEQLKQRH